MKRIISLFVMTIYIFTIITTMTPKAYTNNTSGSVLIENTTKLLPLVKCDETKQAFMFLTTRYSSQNSKGYNALCVSHIFYNDVEKKALFKGNLNIYVNDKNEKVYYGVLYEIRNDGLKGITLSIVHNINSKELLVEIKLYKGIAFGDINENNSRIFEDYNNVNKISSGKFEALTFKTIVNNENEVSNEKSKIGKELNNIVIINANERGCADCHSGPCGKECDCSVGCTLCASCRLLKKIPTNPTASPTVSPTVSPTLKPTEQPTDQPTKAPTIEPTIKPTSSPTQIPTILPTIIPPTQPTVPTVAPTPEPLLKADSIICRNIDKFTYEIVVNNLQYPYPITDVICSIKKIENASIVNESESETTLEKFIGIDDPIINTPAQNYNEISNIFLEYDSANNRWVYNLDSIGELNCNEAGAYALDFKVWRNDGQIIDLGKTSLDIAANPINVYTRGIDTEGNIIANDTIYGTYQEGSCIGVSQPELESYFSLDKSIAKIITSDDNIIEYRYSNDSIYSDEDEELGNVIYTDNGGETACVLTDNEKDSGYTEPPRKPKDEAVTTPYILSEGENEANTQYTENQNLNITSNTSLSEVMAKDKFAMDYYELLCIAPWDVLDIVFAAESIATLIKDPSWENLGWAVLDTAAILPLIPSTKLIRVGCKLAIPVTEIKKLARTEKGLEALRKSFRVLKSTQEAARRIFKYSKITDVAKKIPTSKISAILTDGNWSRLVENSNHSWEDVQKMISFAILDGKEYKTATKNVVVRRSIICNEWVEIRCVKNPVTKTVEEIEDASVKITDHIIEAPTNRYALKTAFVKKYPKPYENAQVHHGLPWKFRDWFAERGLNVNDIRFGSWVRGGGNGGHSSWSKAYENLWKSFIDRYGIRATSEQIEKFYNTIRKYEQWGGGF